MAISEPLCWEVLRSIRGQNVLSTWLNGEHSKDPPLENCLPLFVLERQLVLHHTRSQIEDSLYFLEKRGYIFLHGYRGLTRLAYQLTAQAHTVLASEAFSEEEQTAFREALVDMRQPGVWGMKVNLGEAWRRLKKRVR